jgi:hypothetical protein
VDVKERMKRAAMVKEKLPPVPKTKRKKTIPAKKYHESYWLDRPDRFIHNLARDLK